MTQSLPGSAVESVLGPVSADRLGLILPHEHFPLTVGVCEELEPPPGYLRTVERMQREAVREAQAYGVGTFVEVTPIGMRRTIPLMQRVSRDTGVHVIASTGFYLEGKRPEWVKGCGIDELAERLVAELTEGIPGTTAKAWMIKVGSTPEMTEEDLRVFRAAALASRATGAAITTHSGNAVRRHFDVLVEAGADPSRLYIGHADFVKDLAEYAHVARQGGHLIFTCWGIDHFVDQDALVDGIANLVEAGHARAVLLSIDYAINCSANRMELVSTEYECPRRTPAFLFRDALPRLRARGIGEEMIRQFTVDNPREMLIRPAGAVQPRGEAAARIAAREECAVHPFQAERADDVLRVINAYTAGWPYTRPVDAALPARWRNLREVYQPEHMLIAYRDGEPRAFLHGERQGEQHNIHLLALTPGAEEEGGRLLAEAERRARAEGAKRLCATFYRSVVFYGGYLLGLEPYHPHWAVEATNTYVRAGFRPSLAGVLMVRDLAHPVIEEALPAGYEFVEGEAGPEFGARPFLYAAHWRGTQAAVCRGRLYPGLAAPTGGIIGQLGHVGTQEAHRGKGLARVLVTRSLATLRAWGASEALIATSLDNFPALKAYENAGFQRRYSINEWSKEL